MILAPEELQTSFGEVLLASKNMFLLFNSLWGQKPFWGLLILKKHVKKCFFQHNTSNGCFCSQGELQTWETYHKMQLFMENLTVGSKEALWGPLITKNIKKTVLYVGTLNPSFQLSVIATGTSLRPIADMFLEHMLDPKTFEHIWF